MTVVTGKEALARILHAEGVEVVFGIPGATEVQFMDMIAAHPEIRYVLCLHELVCVGMAEGYARASGKPAVLNLHTGTGLAAGLALLSNAREGGVPLIVTVGQQDTRLLAEEPALSDDLVRIAEPFTKWAGEVRRPEDLPTVMRRAFRVAQRPPTGPVMVSLPLDVLAGSLDFAYPVGGHSFTKLRPDERAVQVAADELAAARRPVLLIQEGVARAGALDQVVRLAEQLGAPVYQQWMSDVVFPVRHPLYLGDLEADTPAGRERLAAADVLVAVGTPVFQQVVPTPAPLLPPTVKLVQFDDDPWQIAKNVPVTCAVEGDIEVALAEVNDALAGRLGGEGAAADAARAAVAGRTAAVAAEKAALEQAWDRRVADRWEARPVSAERLFADLRDALPGDAVVVDDCWSYSAALRRTLDLRRPGQFLRSRRGGSIGEGLPMALGVKLAAPGRPVVCVSGDGSAMWSIQSLWNAARDELPVVFVVLSNRCYRLVRVMTERLLGAHDERTPGSCLDPPEIDFCAIARGMGVAGMRVTQPDDLAGALHDALASGTPYLLDVVVDASL